MIYKYQYGNSLIYKPLQQSILETAPKKEKETITSFLNYNDSETSFPIEPVREWIQPENFDWNSIYKNRPDNFVGERVTAPGKVYKASEKEEFKSDLYNAYMKGLVNRGLDEDTASEFAKRIVAQDALESLYGQSGLSKYYNFGGIKDFRENSDSLKVDTKEHDGEGYKTVKQPFRKFKDLDEYINYKIDLLGNSNYNIFSYKPEMMYRRLVVAPKKYATDPKYEEKLNSIYRILWGR